MAKKRYEGMMLCPVPVFSERPILEGSLTMMTVKVDHVEVDDYVYGFSEDPFDTDFGKDLTFD